MVSNQVRAIPQSLCRPALVLSKSRTIVAVNDALCRLSGRASPESVMGLAWTDLGVELSPTERSEVPSYRDWESLFDTCAINGRQSGKLPNGHNRNSKVDLQRDRTYEFWDSQDYMVPATTNVWIPEHKSSSAAASKGNSRYCRARISVQALHLEGNPMYLVEFHRPQQQEPSSSPPEDAESETESSRHKKKQRTGDVLAEEGLDREVQVHRKVSVAIPYFTALFDMNGEAVHFSTSWNRITDMTPEGTMGKGWIQAFHPDDRLAMTDALENVVKRQQSSWTWEARYRNREGSYKWALIRFESSQKHFGNLNHWYASIMDVDTLLLSRQEAENRRKSIMSLIAETDVSLWSIGKDRNLLLQEGSLSWNPTTTTNGPSSSAKPGNSNTSTSSISDVVDKIFCQKSTVQTLEHKDQERWYRSTLIPDPQGTSSRQRPGQAVQAVLGLTIDITDLRARAELELQNEALTEKERLATEASELKSRFVANISHELRTPIAGIIGMNDLLIESLPDSGNDNCRYFANSIRSSAAQLLVVINDVLDLSKVEAGRLEIESVPFRICQLIDNIYSVMAVQAHHKGISLHCNNVDVPKMSVVVGDPNRLQQVFLNLLSNSIKFTQSGTVKLDVSVQTPARTAQEAAKSEGQSSRTDHPSDDDRSIKIRFIVEDTGCGMTKATLDRMFEAFSQADSSTARRYGGTGLGLTITRKLVEMMGGSITFTSTPDVGTRAVVTITFQKASQGIEEVDLSLTNGSHMLVSSTQNTTKRRRSSAQDDLHPGPTGENVRGSTPSGTVPQALSKTDRNKTLVLIVEDNAVNLKIAKLMTKNLGLQVMTASNGKEALDLLEARIESKDAPLPDVILMDCMMPIMDGYQATKSLRTNKNRFSAKARSIPIIALTASAHKGDMEKCLAAGMDDYLIKPVNKQKLEQALVQWTLIGQERLDRIDSDSNKGENS